MYEQIIKHDARTSDNNNSKASVVSSKLDAAWCQRERPERASVHVGERRQPSGCVSNHPFKGTYCGKVFFLGCGDCLCTHIGDWCFWSVCRLIIRSGSLLSVA